MRIVDSEKQYLVDLKWPWLLPESLPQPLNSYVVAEADSGSNHGQIFQLTGWRGAGWRMLFPEEPAE